MIGALFTAFFFGITPVVAGRAVALIGFVRTNVIRLSFAVLVLGVWAVAFGPGLQGQWQLFVVAGAIGFGIGGLSLLASLSRLGAPLASLIEETIAAAVAVVLAVFWVPKANLTTLQLELCGVILVGVAIGLFPYIPKLPQTEKAVKEILSLPIHGEMGLDAADQVCDAIAEFYTKK